MPINGPSSLRPIDQEEFAQLDYSVMRRAFECQNELGRLCEKSVYQHDLAARLPAEGLATATEVPITVAHRTFSKTYLLDLVVADVGIYELKIAAGLVGAHEAQLLNYLFLCGVNHGKLVNFRPAKVESRFVNAAITPSERGQFTVESDAWRERDQTDRSFRQTLLGLLADWGCRLDLALYTEALVHFAGGEEQVVQRVPLTRGEVGLGTQSFQLINAETAFRVTGLSDGLADHERQLRALLRLSPLRTLHWINLARQHVQLVSLTR